MSAASTGKSIRRDGEQKPFNGVKVFSATMVRQREVLGERVTEWIRDNSDVHVLRTVVAQSSDQQFHCLSIVLFCGEVRPKRGRLEP